MANVSESETKLDCGDKILESSMMARSGVLLVVYRHERYFLKAKKTSRMVAERTTSPSGSGAVHLYFDP